MAGAGGVYAEMLESAGVPAETILEVLVARGADAPTLWPWVVRAFNAVHSGPDRPSVVGWILGTSRNPVAWLRRLDIPEEEILRGLVRNASANDRNSQMQGFILSKHGIQYSNPGYGLTPRETDP